MDYFSLHTSAEFPAFFTILYTVLFAFSLAVVIAFTYYLTTPLSGYSAPFIQALVLSPIVAIMVIQAIGDSVAIGLGMLGALAIIRFRTNFRNPRNIIFLFASLAVGISCGVYGYSIAIVGTLFFCLVAFAFHFTYFGKKYMPSAMIRINFMGNMLQKGLVEEVLHHWCEGISLKNIRYSKPSENEKKVFLEYQIRMKNQSEELGLLGQLEGLDPSLIARIEFEDTTENFN
ncbi:DUF4956 domain-containing protein [Pleomorphovibrio marinus]|uniref:DUF4956 domain-containing protein n=1 Tax=Pleomorphovibrio marinus TaxID=2164132 RepID=UPI000E09E7D4|nr:DUF4956 domain-containing protein [Pleomorphovibrio marinus]